ncbi:hypothetical protein [Bradyrhizobium liaoningense]|uniref:hypothetical protein n=1 Tax=Bradyrhizobium liaoningense TaxID=43992 RepID=UPI001BAE2DD0|nr:hypothetical protein [Bradyrhizobium liaoningense]MBR0855638.1 hypothetical protein [Bradyrhizobium liaoningense]
MSRSMRKAAKCSKSARFPKGNQNFPEGKQISPVMQKVRSSLEGAKAAQQLQFLTEQPLSICQKTLSGHRDENRDMLYALGGTHLIVPALLGLIPRDVQDPWARKLRKAAYKLYLEQEAERNERSEAGADA